MKKLLVGLQVPEEERPGGGEGEDRPRVGIGMDASVTPIPDMPGTSLAQTTDFFYPLVDDPYLQVSLITTMACLLINHIRAVLPALTCCPTCTPWVW